MRFRSVHVATPWTDMPTAEDYWQAASDFEARAHELLSDAPPVATSLPDDVVSGGRLRNVLDEAVDAIVRGIGASADGFVAIAAECRRRAIACRDYTEALRRYQRDHDAWQALPVEQRTGPAPMRPTQPAPWAQPG